MKVIKICFKIFLFLNIISELYCSDSKGVKELTTEIQNKKDQNSQDIINALMPNSLFLKSVIEILKTKNVNLDYFDKNKHDILGRLLALVRYVNAGKVKVDYELLAKTIEAFSELNFDFDQLSVNNQIT